MGASISACGRALCPSCRGAMRVDFDATLGHLSFSRAPASELGSDAPDDDWRQRLYEQAKPKQIQLLQRFGAQQPRPPVPGNAEPSAGAALDKEEVDPSQSCSQQGYQAASVDVVFQP